MKRVFPASRKPVNKYTGISISDAEQLLNFFIIQAGTDNAKASDNTGASTANIGLAWYIVKVKPASASALDDTLGTEDHTVRGILREGFEYLDKLVARKLLCGFRAKAGEHLVSMMMVMVIAVTAASTGALFIVIVVMVLMAMTLLVIVIVVVMLVAMAFLVIVIVVMMLVAMALLVVIVVMVLVAVAVLIIVVVMVMLVAMALLVMVVVMMLVAMAFLVIAVVVVMLVLLLERLYGVSKSVAVFHSGKDVLTVKIVPRGCHDSGIGIVLTEKLNALGDLVILGSLGMRKNDCRGVSDLVVIELAKVLHIHLALVDIGNGGKGVESGVLPLNGLSGSNNIGKLTDAGGLDNNAVGIVLLKHLSQGLRKIADERAADTARIHLGDLDTGIGKEAAVDRNIAELVFNKNYLFAGVSLLDQLLYKSGFSGAEEAGEYVDFRHV